MSATIVPDNHFKTGGHLRRLLFGLIFVILISYFALLIFASSARATTYVNGTISQDAHWIAADNPYIVQAANQGVTVATGATLYIEPGVVIKFEQPTTGLTINGALIAQGATFTSINENGGTNNPAPGDWHGIDFNGSGSLTDCTVRYGGSYAGSGYRGQVSILGSGSVSISGSTFSNGYQYGFYVGGTATAPAIAGSFFSANNSGGLLAETSMSTLSSNTFDHNNGPAIKVPAVIGPGVTGNTYPGFTNKINAMCLTGHVYDNTEWPASNLPYVLEGVPLGPFAPVMETIVQPGKTLTIDPGAVVKSKADLNGSIHADTIRTLKVLGTLNASGAVFTSFFDDSNGGDTNYDNGANGPLPGDWYNIDFEPGSSGNISSSAICYGGSQPYYVDRGEVFINDASPSITGTAVSYSSGSGINIYSGAPSIHYSDIFANGNNGRGNGILSGVAMDATHNYWGSKHGPKPYGIGNGFSGPVNAVPWSRIPFTAAGAAYQATLGLDDYCAYCGDPINTATGAFVYQHKDIEIPTRGLPLEFDRTYNSNDLSDGVLGYGWSFSWQISVSPLANGNVVVLRGDGRQDTFTLNPDGSYSPPAGRHDALSLNATGGTFRLLTQQQVIYNFNSDNALASEVSETGQTTTFAYNANKQLTTITEPAGRTLSVAWGTDPAQANFNRIDHITDPLTHSVIFSYTATADGGADLTSVTDQNNHTTNYLYENNDHRITGITDPENHTSANNIYDAQGRVISQTDADGKLLTFGYVYDPINHIAITTMTRQMDPLDASRDEVTTFYYDSQLRLTRQTDSLGKDTLFSYDGYGNRDSVTDRRGGVTKEVFDSYGNVTDIYKAFGAPEQQHTHYTYNAKNHPLARTDPRGQTTTYAYDASGTYLTQVAYPAVTNYDTSVSNYTQSFTYNPDGTKATFTDAGGDITGYSYDSRGYLSSETRNTNRSTGDQVTIGYSFDDLGRKTRQVDGNGNATDLTYDNLGNLRFVTRQVTDPGAGQPVNVATEYQYDAAGNRTKVIDPEGKATSFTYTPTNRLDTLTDDKLNTIQFTYDAAGNKTDTKDRENNWSHFTFDKNNRMVSAKDPENNVTSFTYDEEGNQISATDPLLRTTTRVFDHLNRATSVTVPDEGYATRTTSYAYDAADHLLSSTDPLTHTISYVYDELGRLRQITDPAGSSTFSAYDGAGNTVKTKDGLGHETLYAYSPNDFLTSVTDPLGGVTSYGYDSNGNRTSQTDAENHTTLYAYDELNRLTNEKVDAGGGNFLLERGYSYDKAGHLLSDQTGAGTISYTYDGVYNLTGITDRQNASYSFTYDANQQQLTAKENATGKTVSFAYSPRGLLSAATDVFGAHEGYSYDSVGNLASQQDTLSGSSFTTSYAYTPRNQLKSVTRGPDTSAFTYDAAGNLASKVYPNGVATSYTYDAGNRPTAIQAAKAGQTLQSYSQTYDQNNNITSLTEAAGVTSYAYDSLNRLTAETIGGYGNISYAYDHTGNRTSLTNPTTGQTSYAYNEANQLISSTNNGTTTDYSYDANGAITTKTTGSDTTSYSYNGLDKLTAVSTPTSSVNYAYDALGRRVQRTEGSDTRNIHLNARSDLPDYWSDSSGSVTASLLRGADGLISFTLDPVTNPNLSYQLYSPHGDTTMIMDSSGNPFFTARYDAFGDAISGAGLWYGYTGKYQRYSDSTTGTIEMGVREYDPSLGRFISQDPLKGTPTDPQQRNRYQYVGNDPLTRYDLDGRRWVLGNEASRHDEYYEGGCSWTSSIDPSIKVHDDVGAFRYDKMINTTNNGINLYTVQIPPDRFIYVCANNPYLAMFAENLRTYQFDINALGCESINRSIAEALDKTGLSNLLEIGLSSNGPEKITADIGALRSNFEKMIIWQEHCGNQCPAE
ncbi:MAG: DUF6531 domain-containing protein [Thermoleophilia bacterium]